MGYGGVVSSQGEPGLPGTPGSIVSKVMPNSVLLHICSGKEYVEIDYKSWVPWRTYCQNLLLSTVPVVEWISLLALSNVQSSRSSSSTDICINPSQMDCH